MKPIAQVAAAATIAAVGWLAGAQAAPAESVDRTQTLEVGQPAPSLSLMASDGEGRSLEGIRGETNVVLVFYRGTW